MRGLCPKIVWTIIALVGIVSVFSEVLAGSSRSRSRRSPLPLPPLPPLRNNYIPPGEPPILVSLSIEPPRLDSNNQNQVKQVPNPDYYRQYDYDSPAVISVAGVEPSGFGSRPGPGPVAFVQSLPEDPVGLYGTPVKVYSVPETTTTTTTTTTPKPTTTTTTTTTPKPTTTTTTPKPTTTTTTTTTPKPTTTTTTTKRTTTTTTATTTTTTAPTLRTRAGYAYNAPAEGIPRITYGTPNY